MVKIYLAVDLLLLAEMFWTLIFWTDFHRCSKSLSGRDQDTAPCDWYRRVYKSLCPMAWVCSYRNR